MLRNLITQKLRNNSLLTIARYHYSEVAKPLSSETWKLVDFQVLLPGSCLTTISSYRYLEIPTKNPSFINISPETKIFSKIFLWIILHRYRFIDS